jgi:hypothetical protein
MIERYQALNFIESPEKRGQSVLVSARLSVKTVVHFETIPLALPSLASKGQAEMCLKY